MFTIEEEIPWRDIERQLRETTLLNQPDALPYAESDIIPKAIDSHYFEDGVPGISPDYPVRPTTKYVLAENLAFQARLTEDLDQQGYNQLSLIGGLVLRNTETNTRSVLVPPILERTERDGLYILDGAHRLWNGKGRDPVTGGDYLTSYRYTARPAARLVMAAVVSEPAYPSYAHPNNWRDISVVNRVPTDPADKKDYRTDYPGGYRALYRDFSHLGSSGLRGA